MSEQNPEHTPDDAADPVSSQSETVPPQDEAHISSADHEATVTALEAQLETLRAQYLSAEAEMQNVRRRAERETSNARKFGAEKLLRDLLPVWDSLQRALESPVSGDPQAVAMRKGLSMTADLLKSTLEKHGARPIEPKAGEVFNPECHEVMSMMSNPDAEPNTIAEVIQPGFDLNGRILRAAMVIVNAA